MPNFAPVVSPLNHGLETPNLPCLLGKKAKNFKPWTHSKTVYYSPSVLEIHYSDRQVILNTNLCNLKIACVYLQKHPDETKKLIWDWSLLHNKSEQRYSTAQREFLKIVWSDLLLYPYLKGQRCTLQTDHDAQKCMLNISDSAS